MSLFRKKGGRQEAAPPSTLDVILNRIILPLVVDGEVFSAEDVKRGMRWWWFPGMRAAWRNMRGRLVVLEHLVETGEINPDVCGCVMALYIETGSGVFLRAAKDRSEGVYRAKLEAKAMEQKDGSIIRTSSSHMPPTRRDVLSIGFKGMAN